MDEIVTNRYLIQYATLIIAVASCILLVRSVHRGIIPWRYSFLPFAILVQLIIFYTIVISTRPTPSATITFWSAVIRLETVAGFFIALWGVYRNND